MCKYFISISKIFCFRFFNIIHFNIGGRGTTIHRKNNAPIKLPLGRGKIL